MNAIATQPIKWTALSEKERRRVFFDAFDMRIGKDFAIYPPLTLDLLFEVADRGNFYIGLERLNIDRWGAYAEGHHYAHKDKLTALVVSMLRYRGLQIEV